MLFVFRELVIACHKYPQLQQRIVYMATDVRQPAVGAVRSARVTRQNLLDITPRSLSSFNSSGYGIYRRDNSYFCACMRQIRRYVHTV